MQRYTMGGRTYTVKGRDPHALHETTVGVYSSIRDAMRACVDYEGRGHGYTAYIKEIGA